MNRMLRIALMCAITGALGACGAGESEQSHAHDGGEPHAHEPASSPPANDTGEGHAHGEDAHTHDGASETQAFYGDEADASEEVAAGHKHPHGDESHTHDQDTAGDEADEPDHPHGDETHTHDDQGHGRR